MGQNKSLLHSHNRQSPNFSFRWHLPSSTPSSAAPTFFGGLALSCMMCNMTIFNNLPTVKPPFIIALISTKTNQQIHQRLPTFSFFYQVFEVVQLFLLTLCLMYCLYQALLSVLEQQAQSQIQSKALGHQISVKVWITSVKKAGNKANLRNCVHNCG